MPDFTPEPLDPIVVPDPAPPMEPDVDAVLAAHAAGERRVFHGWNMAAFNKMYGDHVHLRGHIAYDIDLHTVTLR